MQVMKNDTQVIDKNFMDKQIDFIKNKPIGIHTGFVDLDYQWGGLKKGDTYLIAARPAMGKTAFILNMMLHMAIKEEKKVALFSLEQSKEMIVNRMLAIDSRVEANNLLSVYARFKIRQRNRSQYRNKLRHL